VSPRAVRTNAGLIVAALHFTDNVIAWGLPPHYTSYLVLLFLPCCTMAMELPLPLVLRPSFLFPSVCVAAKAKLGRPTTSQLCLRHGCLLTNVHPMGDGSVLCPATLGRVGMVS
jgi:hypothetical protein